MAFGNKRFGGAFNKGGQKGNNGGSGTSTTNNGAYNGKPWSPTVDHAVTEYDKKDNIDRYIFALDWIFPADKTVFMSFLNSIDPSHTVMKIFDSPNNDKSIIFKIPVDKIDDFEKYILPQLVDSIERTNHYYGVNKLADKVMSAIKKAPTSKDMEAAEGRIATNWQQMLEKLQDPSVRQRLLNFQTTNKAKKWGGVLSPKNKIMVLSQFPNAAFVTDADTWASKFNRRVMPNATKITIIRPSSNPSFTRKELDAAAQALNHASYSDAKKYKSQQVINAIHQEANKMFKSKSFFATIVYDVSETIPNDPNNDIWTKEIGLANNLIGIPNQLAAAEELKRNPTVDPVQKQVGLDKAKIDEIAKKMNIRFNRDKKVSLANRNSEQIIIAIAQRYATDQLPKLSNVINPKNVSRLALAVSVAVAVSCDIQSQNMVSFYNGKYGGLTVSKEDAILTYNIYKDLVGCINENRHSAMIFEHVLNRGEFFNLLQNDLGIEINDEERLEESEKTKEQIQESFKKMYERLNNVIL